MKKIIYTYLLVFSTIFAHPHIFMEANIKVDIDDSILKGVFYEINYDEVNSVLMSSGYKIGVDGSLLDINNKKIDVAKFPFSTNELNAFKVSFNGRKLRVTPNITRIFISEGYLVYDVYIPLNIMYKKGDKLNISVYDDDYYYDFYYDEYAIKIQDKKGFNHKINLKKNKGISYYMGLMHPMEYEVIL